MRNALKKRGSNVPRRRENASRSRDPRVITIESSSSSIIEVELEVKEVPEKEAIDVVSIASNKPKRQV